MVRKKVLIRKKDNKIIDAGLAESRKDPVDPEVSQEFDEAKKLAGSGSSVLQQKLREHNSRTPDLTADDIDADWEGADVGDETVGGDNMTPDQSVVEEIGEALGITHDDNEPLRTSAEELDSPRRKRTRATEEGREESNERAEDWE